jgi:tape measure domain-containing protein
MAERGAVVGTAWFNVAANVEGLGSSTRQAAEDAARGAGEGFKGQWEKATGQVGQETGRKQGEGFAQAVAQATEGVGQGVSEALDQATGRVGEKIGRREGQGLASAFAGAVRSNLSTVSGWLGQAFPGVGRLWAKITDGASTAWAKIASGASQAWAKVSSTASQAWSAVSSTASRAAETIKSTVTSAVSKVWDPVSRKGAQAWQAVASKVSPVLSRIGAGVKQLAAPWAAVGQAAGRTFGALGQTAGRAFSAVAAKIKSVFTRARQDSDAEAEKVPSAWQRALGKIAEFGSKAASQLKGVLGGAATAAAAGLAAGLGAALKGGFDRLTSVENASAQMRGLGLASEQVEAVMADVRAQVQGTAFGTSEMARAASQALTAGVKPGEQLNSYMTALKNTAAAAGAPLDDIQLTFGQIQSAGKAVTQDLMQLSTRGIPAFDLLSQHMGVSVTEVKKLVEEGKVAPEQVFAALNSGLGLMADEMANTTQGAFTNAKTSLSRFGEALLQTEFPVFKTGALLFKEIMNAAIALIEPLKQAFDAGGGSGLNTTLEGLIPKVQAFTEQVKAGGSVVGDIVGKIRDIGGSVGQVAALAAPLLGGMMGNLPVIGRLFTGLTGPLGMVIGLVGAMLTNSSALGSSVGRVGSSLMAAFANPAVGRALKTVADVIGQVAGQAGDLLADVLDAIVPVIADLVPMLADLVSSVLPPIGDAIGLIMAGVAPLVTQLVEGLAPVITTLVEAVMPPLISVFEAVVPVIGTIVEALTPVISTIIDVMIPVIQNLAGVVGPVFDNIASAVKSALNVVKGIINTIMAAIRGDWSGAWDAIMGIFSNLLDIGKNIITGIVKGITGAAGAIKDAVVNAAKSALGAVGRFLGIASPSRVFRDRIGRQIGAGLVQGLDDSVPAVTQAGLRMADAAIAAPKIPGIVPGSLTAANWTSAVPSARTTADPLGALQGARLKLVVGDKEFEAWVEAEALGQVKAWALASRRGGR